MKQIFAAIFALAFTFLAQAQTTIQIIDSKTSEPIPFANILVNSSDGQISNADGKFTLTQNQDKPETTVVISYIGYHSQALNLSQIQKTNNTVRLVEAPFELDNVQAKKTDPRALIAEVAKNLKENYTGKGGKDSRIFFRQLSTFKPSTLDVEITKSTGFKKKALVEVNNEIAQMTNDFKKKNITSYSDVLFNLYSHSGKSKAIVHKGTSFSESTEEDNLDAMQKKFTNAFLKHLDTTKFYRIKSGWIGSRDTISLSKSYNEKKKKNKKEKEEDVMRSLTNLKSGINGDLSNVHPLNNKKLFQFVNDPNAYDFALDGVMVNGLNDFVYVVDFKPKKGRALYSGKVYISDSDYGIVRLDYKLAEGKKLEGINLKLVLGVKFAENQGSGTVIYRRDASNHAYQVHYASVSKGMYLYMNRPFKFIELTDEDKDVVAFDIKVEGVQNEKYEILRMTQQEISQADFDVVKEEAFKYTKIKKYDPSIWKDYGIIEPVEEMKRLNISDKLDQ